MTSRRRLTTRGWVLGLAATTAVAVSCGGDDQVTRGEAVAQDVGCLACHSAGTDDRIGPGWGGIWGTERQLDDGRTVVVDEPYLRRSISEPRADVVAGWEPIMPAIPLSDEELDDVVAYLREVAGG